MENTQKTAQTTSVKVVKFNEKQQKVIEFLTALTTVLKLL